MNHDPDLAELVEALPSFPYAEERRKAFDKLRQAGASL
jgi:hypothetical protein